MEPYSEEIVLFESTRAWKNLLNYFSSYFYYQETTNMSRVAIVYLLC